MLVGLWLYAYGVGVFASRTSALACERPLACSAMVGPERPDCRTISDGRTLPLEAFTAVLVQGGRLAAEAGLVQWGNGATDGTTLQGQAARHQAMSDGDMQQAGARRRADLAAWVTPASQQDEADAAALGRRRGDALPAAVARRAQRLARSVAARRRWEAQAQAEAAAARQRANGRGRNVAARPRHPWRIAPTTRPRAT
jgi:hypothetical protein